VADWPDSASGTASVLISTFGVKDRSIDAQFVLEEGVAASHFIGAYQVGFTRCSQPGVILHNYIDLVHGQLAATISATLFSKTILSESYFLCELFVAFYSNIPEHMDHIKYLFIGLHRKSAYVPWM
jgi:hypothetical protein